MIHTMKRRETNCIGHILCRNCLLKHIIAERMCNLPLDDHVEAEYSSTVVFI